MQFLVTYWAQITVILVSIGFILQQIIEYQFKIKELRFNTFHLERAEYVRKLFRQITDLKQSIGALNLAHYMYSSDMRLYKHEWEPYFKEVLEQMVAIDVDFSDKRILFNKAFGKRIDNLITVLREEFIEPSLDKNVLIQDETKEFIFNNTERFQAYYENNFPKLLDELEKEFRKYI